MNAAAKCRPQSALDLIRSSVFVTLLQPDLASASCRDELALELCDQSPFFSHRDRRSMSLGPSRVSPHRRAGIEGENRSRW